MSTRPYLRTASGRDFYFDKPDAIRIEDIAAALAKINRFNGHTRVPYSVAQHSIWVSHRVAEAGHGAKYQMLGLLHDAAEAYLGDLTAPVQVFIFGTGIGRSMAPSDWDHAHAILNGAIEATLMPAEFFTSAPAFTTASQAVSHADLMALRTEWRELMSGPEPGNFARMPAAHPDRIFPYENWQTAREQFLIRFHQLVADIKSEAAQ